MKFIVITPPEFFEGEADAIATLFDCGLDTLHLRKPEASEGDYARLLDAMPEHCRRNTVVHDHFSLCLDYDLKGIHLNSRHPLPPAGFRPLSVSASCHGLAQVREFKAHCDYVFLSPVFDSISKQGYLSAYSPEELDEAAAAGVTDGRVIALGGVSLDNICRLRRWHFGGAAFLGDVWGRVHDSSFKTYVGCLRRELDR